MKHYLGICLVLLTLAGIAFFALRSCENAIDHTVALLIVTCPCVLGLATPLTIAIAIVIQTTITNIDTVATTTTRRKTRMPC